MTNDTTAHRAPARTVLLAGATGVLGRHISRALAAAGHRVVGLGRGPANDLRADLTDRDAVLRAVAGQHADVVVHAATALRKPPVRHADMDATDTLRTVGTANLLAAAREVGAHRFIAESMVFGYGYGDHGDRPLTEAGAPFAPPGATPALERHIAAMRTKEELTLGADGIDGIALRFGLFYGPGGTEALLPMLRRRVLPATPDRGLALPWVELTDAAAAVALAVDHGTPGQAYNIADATPLGFGSHLRLVADAFGLPRPMTVPRWTMRPMGYVHAVLGSNLRVDSTLAAAELGWRPVYPDARAGLAALLRSTEAGGHRRNAQTTSTASAHDAKSE
ncbi:NAD-dependent epimerase/dehydratase family protein [Streptomyces sp. NPDC049040]|uniref:NAD-dependent epimerase/dehydratase family protein n=1 Tax=Streptomyces sp. NPDC049040 TaxID=3365593 RepID=UPI00371872BF